jgi:uncharacterized protein YktB (UPF0637 family)
VSTTDIAEPEVTFGPEDFAIFDSPEFAVRMPRIRAEIKPRLMVLGAALLPDLSAVLKEPLYLHVAQHLRRTVNPPEATWAAYARTQRAYKPTVHIRSAIHGGGIRVSVFVEDYAEDKALFAEALAANADNLASYLGKHSEILAFDIPDAAGKPMHGDAITADTLRAFSEKMLRVKSQHAVFGIELPARKVAKMRAAEFHSAIVKAVKKLKPLYDLGR